MEGCTYILLEITSLTKNVIEHVKLFSPKSSISKSTDGSGYLENVIGTLLKDTMALKFTSHILEFNKEDTFIFKSVTYKLLRMACTNTNIDVVYENTNVNGESKMMIESLGILEGMKITTKHGNDTAAEADKSSDFLKLHFLNQDKSSYVVKYFIVSSLRSILENFQYFVIPHLPQYNDLNRHLMLIEFLVPLKWENINKYDNEKFKTKLLNIVNSVRKGRKMDQQDKDKLSSIKIVPTSYSCLEQYLEVSTVDLTKDNISFVTCSRTRIKVLTPII